MLLPRDLGHAMEHLETELTGPCGADAQLLKALNNLPFWSRKIATNYVALLLWCHFLFGFCNKNAMRGSKTPARSYLRPHWHLADQAILCPREASLIAAGRPQVSPRAAPRWHFYCDNEQFSDCKGNFSAVLTNLPAPRGLDDE